MSVFTQKEIEYLATVGPDGTPHVAPVGMFSRNAEPGTVVVSGRGANRLPGIDTDGFERNSRSIT